MCLKIYAYINGEILGKFLDVDSSITKIDDAAELSP